MRIRPETSLLRRLESTVERMTGRTAAEIRQAPLPRWARLPSEFISSNQINHDLDRALRT